jgi:HlyD family secretion protein
MVSGLAGAWRWTVADEPAKTPATHTVKSAPFRVDVKFSGILEATDTKEIELDSEEWAQWEVAEVVPHGKKVSAGETLIRFKKDKLEKAVRDAEIGLSLLKLGVKLEELDIAAMDVSDPINLEHARRSKKHAEEDLQRYREVEASLSEKSRGEQLRMIEDNVDDQKSELEQLEKMYKADDLTEETEEIVLKRARSQYERAKFSLEMAKSQADRALKLDLPRHRLVVEDAEKSAGLSLSKLEKTQPIAREKADIELQRQRSALTKAEQAFERLKGDLAKTEIKAPIAGTVYYGSYDNGKWTPAGEMAKTLRPGGTAAAKATLLTIVAAGAPRIHGTVSEKDFSHLKAAMTGRASLIAFPRERTAIRIESVAEVPSSDGQFAVVAVPGESWPNGAVAGMNCEIVVNAYSKPDAVVLPTKLIHGDLDTDGTRYVYVQTEGNKPERRSVVVGNTNAGDSEIVSGLKAGEKVLLEAPAE